MTTINYITIAISIAVIIINCLIIIVRLRS